jgi:hypothetical protein
MPVMRPLWISDFLFTLNIGYRCSSLVSCGTDFLAERRKLFLYFEEEA